MIRLQIGGDWHWLIYSIVGFGNLSQHCYALVREARGQFPCSRDGKKPKALPLADPLEELLLP